MAENGPPPDGIDIDISPTEKRVKYIDVLEITRKIENENDANPKFSSKLARYWDIKRAVRTQVETGTITQDKADYQLALLMAGMDTETKEKIENYKSPEVGFSYQKVLEIIENIEYKHLQQRSFTLNVARFFVLQKILQTEVNSGRITHDDADRQSGILMAGMNTNIRELLEQKIQHR